MGVQSSFSEEHSLMGSRRLGRRNRTDFPLAGHGYHSPPWEAIRTVVQGQEDSDYSGLKQRLKCIPIRSRHRRQKLYQDATTRQYWLGVIVSISHQFERCEVLKPLPVDTAESLL